MVNIQILESEVLPIKILDGTEALKVEVLDTIINVLPEGEVYRGPYEVIPKAYDNQTLETKDKHMLDDVTVNKVPYYETSNRYGDTVYIAAEVNE